MDELKKSIFTILDTNTWTTTSELIENLKIRGFHLKARRLRGIIKECRFLYKNDIIDELIIKSNRGYKLSTNKDEIIIFINELLESGNSMIREANEIEGALHKRLLFEEQNKKNIETDRLLRSVFLLCIKQKILSNRQILEISKAMIANVDSDQLLKIMDPSIAAHHMKLLRQAIELKADADKIPFLVNCKLNYATVNELYQLIISKKSTVKEIQEFVKEKETEQEDEIKKINKG